MATQKFVGTTSPIVDTDSTVTGGHRPEVAAPMLAPAKSLKAVTPADSDLPDGTCRALWVGGAGNLSLMAADDSSVVTVAGVPAGTLLPIRAKQVRAATTATSIVALY